jgi:hypothetical protein
MNCADKRPFELFIYFSVSLSNESSLFKAFWGKTGPDAGIVTLFDSRPGPD